jgi:hypothetical protein
MSTKSKVAAALAVVTLATSLALPSSAEAHGRRWGFAAGLIGAAIVSSAIANSVYAEPVYDDDYVRCRFVRQYDKFGNYIGKARVCRYVD